MFKLDLEKTEEPEIKLPTSIAFSGCGREPWVPLICVGDLRQLLRVPLRSQGHCGFGRGPSLLNWVWCNRRGPHLEWRQEPQGSSPYVTRVAGYLQSMEKRVTPRLLWRNGFPLAFRVVHGVTGHLLSRGLLPMSPSYSLRGAFAVFPLKSRS